MDMQTDIKQKTKRALPFPKWFFIFCILYSIKLLIRTFPEFITIPIYAICIFISIKMASAGRLKTPVKVLLCVLIYIAVTATHWFLVISYM